MQQLRQLGVATTQTGTRESCDVSQDPRHWNQECMQIFLNVLFRRCHNQTHLWRGQSHMTFCSFPHRVEVSEVSRLTEEEIADIPAARELLRMLYPLRTISSQCSAQRIQEPQCHDCSVSSNQGKSVLLPGNCRGTLPKSCSPKPRCSLYFMHKIHLLADTFQLARTVGENQN